MAERPVRVLFVCLGNICRSPTAEGVMRHLVAEAGLEGEVEIESAGTGGWHVGHPPDERATAAAAGRGIALEGAARRVEPSDLDHYDYVIAMDGENHADLLAMARGPEHEKRITLLRSFDHDSAREGDLDVPDPYYGGAEGFEHVLDLVERACRALLRDLADRHKIATDGNA
jgi:protein-tyrosine phosphatase